MYEFVWCKRLGAMGKSWECQFPKQFPQFDTRPMKYCKVLDIHVYVKSEELKVRSQV